jgi:hypothetical protein
LYFYSKDVQRIIKKYYGIDDFDYLPNNDPRFVRYDSKKKAYVFSTFEEPNYHGPAEFSFDSFNRDDNEVTAIIVGKFDDSEEELSGREVKYTFKLTCEKQCVVNSVAVNIWD